jgi:predicted nuclease of predicted toxin-antitoxin system
VKFKLDENIPRVARAQLTALGWDVDDVYDERLAGAIDREIQAACESEGRILITLDTDFADIRRYDPTQSPGVSVLRPRDQSIQACLACLGGGSPAMPQSPLRLIRRSLEYLTVDEVGALPPNLRGIYVLYEFITPRGRSLKPHYDVVYVGMARKGGIRGRLRSHKRSKRKLWTHCSVFEVWDNIRDDEVAELEGLFRHLYRDDSTAGALNKQRGFKPMRRLERIELSAGKARPPQ